MSSETTQTYKRNSFIARWLRPKLAIPITLLMVLFVSPVLYRGWRLGQVPLADEPFDVGAFLTEIPRDENAYLDFEQAGRELRPIPRADYEQYQTELETGWNFNTAILDKHLENNRAALKTWLEATEKARYQPPSEWTPTKSPLIAVSPTRELHRLANTQIQKFGRTNRPADAIPWIRAQLRFAHLIRRKGDFINYTVGVALFSEMSRTISNWAAHPELSRPDIDLVREALKDARRQNPSPSDFVKSAYIAERSFLELTYDTLVDDAFSETYGSTSWRAWLEAEPEYSIRLYPHVARNHLLFIEEDRRDRPELINEDLFEDTSATPAQRGDLRAERLAALIQGAYVRRSSRLKGTLNLIDRDEARYRCLTVALAAQAYFRDHSEFPADANQLVPEYLEEIPDDLFSATPAPLIYRRDGDGAVVYSRYFNEIDDGGIEVDYDERSTRGDLLDLGFRIRNPFDRPLVAPKP